jgi:hypothetical protein
MPSEQRVCMLGASLGFPKLPSVQNGFQDSRRVCLLIEILDDLVCFPSTCRRNVLNGNSLWRRSPPGSVSVPEASLMILGTLSKPPNLRLRQVGDISGHLVTVRRGDGALGVLLGWDFVGCHEQANVATPPPPDVPSRTRTRKLIGFLQDNRVRVHAGRTSHVVEPREDRACDRPVHEGVECSHEHSGEAHYVCVARIDRPGQDRASRRHTTAR